MIITCPICKREFDKEESMLDAIWHTIMTKEHGFIGDVCDYCFENNTDEEIATLLGYSDDKVVW